MSGPAPRSLSDSALGAATRPFLALAISGLLHAWVLTPGSDRAAAGAPHMAAAPVIRFALGPAPLAAGQAPDAAPASPPAPPSPPAPLKAAARTAEPRATAQAPKPPAPSPAAVAPPQAQRPTGAPPLLQAAAPPASGHWRFELQTAQGVGTGTLVWEQDGSQYRLHLTRTSGQRNLPGWSSEGRLVAGGLQPLRFSVQRGPRRLETVDFLPDEGLARFSSLGTTQAVPELTQDRLSWIVQLVALARAAPAESTALRIARVGWRGGQRVLVFRRQALAAGDPAHWQRWRGEHDPADGFEVEAWLDPTQNHWPQRLRQTFEGEPRSEWRDTQAARL